MDVAELDTLTRTLFEKWEACRPRIDGECFLRYFPGEPWPCWRWECGGNTEELDDWSAAALIRCAIADRLRLWWHTDGDKPGNERLLARVQGSILGGSIEDLVKAALAVAEARK